MMLLLKLCIIYSVLTLMLISAELTAINVEKNPEMNARVGKFFGLFGLLSAPFKVQRNSKNRLELNLVFERRPVATVFSHYWMPFIDTEQGYNVYNNHYLGSSTGVAEQQAELIPEIASNTIPTSSSTSKYSEIDLVETTTTTSTTSTDDSIQTDSTPVNTLKLADYDEITFDPIQSSKKQRVTREILPNSIVSNSIDERVVDEFQDATTVESSTIENDKDGSESAPINFVTMPSIINSNVKHPQSYYPIYPPYFYTASQNPGVEYTDITYNSYLPSTINQILTALKTYHDFHPSPRDHSYQHNNCHNYNHNQFIPSDHNSWNYKGK